VTDGVAPSPARTLTISRNRAAAAGAYTIERLSKDGFVLCIRKGDRLLATAGVDARQEELLGLAAAPALARSVVALLRATTPDERAKAEGMARAALFAAGVEVK